LEGLGVALQPPLPVGAGFRRVEAQDGLAGADGEGGQQEEEGHLIERRIIQGGVEEVDAALDFFWRITNE